MLTCASNEPTIIKRVRKVDKNVVNYQNRKIIIIKILAMSISKMLNSGWPWVPYCHCLCRSVFCPSNLFPFLNGHIKKTKNKNGSQMFLKFKFLSP
jgi:hypothetical protein